MGKRRRREFDQKTRIAIAERATDAHGVLRCEGVGLRVRGRCSLAIKGERQIDHINPDWAGGKPTAENGQLLCPECYGVKNPLDTAAFAKNERMKANKLGVTTPTKSPIPQRPKKEKPPSKPLPRRVGGIYARFFGKEQ